MRERPLATARARLQANKEAGVDEDVSSIPEKVILSDTARLGLRLLLPETFREFVCSGNFVETWLLEASGVLLSKPGSHGVRFLYVS